MFFNYITLLSALLISSVAIFFSVAGLVAIFPAYAWSIIVMGTSLELGKLVAAVWLHRNWKTAVWYLRWYLAIAVAVLMFITSMGIFGYLSKSHVEQASQSQEGIAQVDRVASEIARNEAIILRANAKIKGFGENGSSLDSSLNRQIDKEQARIDSAYSRVQPSIDAQTATIKAEQNNIKTQQDLYRNEITRIDAALQVPGADDDALNKKRRTALWRVRTAASKNEAVKVARKEIASIRSSVKKEIAASNTLIDRLRKRMGKSTEQDIEKLIGAQQDKIKDANKELDTLTEQKYKIEAAGRKLEAEVGPIKYIAKFIYDQEADANLLEKAVTWVIIMLILVFDPLAVLLLIATQYAFEEHEEEVKRLAQEIKDKKEAEKKAREMAATSKRDEAEAKKEAKRLDKERELIAKEDAAAERKEKREQKRLDKELELARLQLRAKEIPPEPAMPENEIVNEHEVIPLTEHIVEEILEIVESESEPFERSVPLNKELILDQINDLVKNVDEVQEEVLEVEIAHKKPWEDLNELSTIADGINNKVSLVKVGENYINFNGKVYRTQALHDAHPELNLDFASQVKSGEDLPSNARDGLMFLVTSDLPVMLYRFNGKVWDSIDKNLLEFQAYSHEYIKTLIKKVGTGEYNPDFLNDYEKKHIEDLIANGDYENE